MAKFQASLTEGPTLNTSDPAGSVTSMATYAVGAGMTLFLLGVGRRVVAPVFDGITTAATGGKVSSGDSGASSGGMGGLWGDI